MSYTPLNSAPHAMQPKKSADAVEMFTTQKPSRPYVEVGLIEAQRSSDISVDRGPAIMAKMRQEGAKRGCDALLVLGSNDAVVGSSTRGTGSVTTLEGYRSTCVVYTTPATTAAPAPTEAPPSPAQPTPSTPL